MKLELLTNAEIQEAVGYTHGHNVSEFDIAIAQAQLDKLLNLCYACKECGGSGKHGFPNPDVTDFPECPSCNGTGKGEPMIAIVAEEQEMSKCPDDISKHGVTLLYEAAQRDLITPKDGTIWKKVKV